MKVGILLLCHESPDYLARFLSLDYFRNSCIKIYLHYDGKRSPEDFAALQAALPESVSIDYALDRIQCRWGEYSLVEATDKLFGLALSDESFAADYLVLMSGSCAPIRPFASLQEFLRRRNGFDFIQAHDIRKSRWIKDGLEIERCQYYFPFNFITHRRWFETATRWQQRLKVERKIPEELVIHFGSQWFCLTRETARKVHLRLQIPALQSFFRHSWIPDEFAIQTLVADAQKKYLISGFPLTYYEFDEQGRPLILDTGHLLHLQSQPYFFARKVAPEAEVLRAELDALCNAEEYDLSYFDDVGRATIDYQSFLTEAKSKKSRRSHIGSIKDPWRGLMDVSARRYYVLYSSSKSYLLSLLDVARQGTELPIFDMPFDLRELKLARGCSKFFGFQASDKWRRDYDPASFLHELVYVDPVQPAAFGLDASSEGWVRDFVRWDRNAILINIDPLTLSKEQSCAAVISHLGSAQDAALLARTMSAYAKSEPLPHDHYHRVWESKEYSCQFVALHVSTESKDCATLAALQGAAQWLDAGKFFLTHEAAVSLLEN